MVPTRIIPPVSRSLAAALALFFAGACGSEPVLSGAGGDADSDDDGSGDDDGGGNGGEPPAPEPSVCTVAAECVAVSSTCCECPTFAVPSDSTYAEACNQVECDDPIGCPLVEPVCQEEQCQLVCSAVELPTDDTRQDCKFGFARDSFGCLVGDCRDTAPDPRYACDVDEDCTQVQADCCGCLRGGADTAIAVIAFDDYLESLGCTPDPSCPGLDVCDASLVPRCIAATCMLAPAGPDDGDGGDDGDGDGDDGSMGGDPSVFCGAAGLPDCPAPERCFLNHPDSPDANRMGVGSCHAP